MNRIIPSKPSARRITGRAFIVNAITVCVLAVGGRATAHPEFNAATTNRYLKIDLVSPSELRLAYTVMYGAGPAYAERKRADANGDGKLDENESRTLGESLRSAVSTGLKLELDGKPVTLSFDAPVVGLAGPEVGPSAFSVDLIGHLSCPGSSHTLVLDDNTPLAELGESEIRVEESPATRLLESHRGKGAGPRESRILFRGPKFSALEDRSITIRFEAGAHPAAAASTDKKLPVQRVALLVIVGLAVVGVLLMLRRYRRS
jgi:hypothetical protein